MNRGIILGITTVLIALSFLGAEASIYAEFEPPDNGGPSTTQGSGTRLTS